MKIAFVGCGYVFDIYMRTRWAHPELEICGVFDIDTVRSATVSEHYGFHVYPSYDALLADPAVEVVINLTSIRSHYDTIKRALEAGKHVYSEKPLTTDLDQTRELFALAEARGLVFTGAPCNLYCDAVSRCSVASSEIGGRRVPLVRRWKSHAVEAERGVGRSLKHKFVSWLRRREIYAQDKLLGIAESRAMEQGRSQPMPPDFLMHLNELTLLIQRAGTAGVATAPTTSFAPLQPLPDVSGSPRDYRKSYRPRLLERLSAGIVDTLHKR